MKAEILNEMKEWFETHSPQSNFALFKKMINDDEKWNIILLETYWLPNSCHNHQRLYHFYNDIYEIPKCKNCGKQLEFKMFSKPYLEFCSKRCKTSFAFKDGTMDKSIQKKTDTFKKRFGKGTDGGNELKERKKKTLLDRYGVDTPMKIPEVKEKYRKNSIEKYGVDWCSKSQEIKDKIVEGWKNNPDKDFIDKKRHENYKKSMQEKYGVDSSFQLEFVQNKRKETLFKNYNVSVPCKNTFINDKLKQTNLTKYGFENPMQSDEIQRKQFLSSVKLKTYILPSGKEIKYQGYLNKALDILLKEYNENDLLIEFDCPKIKYIYKNKNHYYRPDIYVKPENKILEIKSNYTYKYSYERNIIKREFSVKNGYNFEFWIFDNDILTIK